LFLFESAPRTLPVKPRSLYLSVSLGVHLLVAAWLLTPWLPAKSPGAYDQMIRPHETRLVWYTFKDKLPDVSPPKPRAEDRPLKAEALSKQSIVSAPVNAPKTAQVIIHPAPEIKPQPLKPLPNLIALAAPPPKQFAAPEHQARRTATKVAELEPAPAMEARVHVPDLPKLPTPAKPFVRPPDRVAKLTAHVEVNDAPELNPASNAATNSLAAKVLDQGSRTLAFRPQPKRVVTASIGTLPDVPDLKGTSSTANVAVIGLNAIDSLKVPLPDSSHRGQLSAGPVLRPDGATSAGGGSGITVPDLTIRGGDKDAAQALIAKAMAPDRLSRRPDGNAREVARTTTHDGGDDDPTEPARPAGVRVSGAPDPRFLGRTVFSVALQSPNLTSHSGSWLMWYADREFESFQVVISAPQPMHEVDPKYIATAIEERVEGTVRLAFVIGRDGRVYGVQTVKGLDQRLDQSATEALSKWVFAPATRQGKPIEVDALVDIPFRLAPKVAN
jgi:TonB family protein